MVARKVWLLLTLTVLTAQESVRFDDYFSPLTLRLDLYHTGTKTQSCISLDEIIQEPVWAGSRIHLIDPFNYGEHLVSVFDLSTDRLLYTRGFSSLFAEWQTTDEAAQEIFRTFSFSVLTPFPKKPVRITIATRDRNNTFITAFETTIDPESRFVRRDRPSRVYKPRTLIHNGSPAQKVDILLLPEGYTRHELRQFHRDIKSLVKALFEEPPFRENRDKFNVWYLDVASPQSGIDNPREFQFVASAFDLTFNSFDLDRYVLAFNNKKIRDIAGNAPYDQLYFVFNSSKYGGGGIYNLFSTCYARSVEPDQAWIAQYVFVHEFGHAFAGLGDEYYTSDVAYNEFYPTDIEPWEPNLTVLENPDQLKWRDLVEAGTPLPTPWQKTLYDETPRRETQQSYDLLRSQQFWGKVGAFEGGGYSSNGIYRPFLDCRMFSKSLSPFCPVCQKAIREMIKIYAE